MPFEKGHHGSEEAVEINIDTGKEKERVEPGSSFCRYGSLQKNWPLTLKHFK